MKKRLKSEFGVRHKLLRFLFSIVWNFTVRPLPRNYGNNYIRFILRIFGAKMSNESYVYSSAKIYMPSNLVMMGFSSIGPNVNVYNVDKIIIKDQVEISQGVHLCTASHDITVSDHHLITAPIIIEERSWIAADAFIGMGVIIGQGAVVGARAAVFKNVEPWTVVGGNPAKFIKKRILIQ